VITLCSSKVIKARSKGNSHLATASNVRTLYPLTTPVNKNADYIKADGVRTLGVFYERGVSRENFFPANDQGYFFDRQPATYTQATLFMAEWLNCSPLLSWLVARVCSYSSTTVLSKELTGVLSETSSAPALACCFPASVICKSFLTGVLH
jgi:hypothetical protein